MHQMTAILEYYVLPILGQYCNLSSYERTVILKSVFVCSNACINKFFYIDHFSMSCSCLLHSGSHQTVLGHNYE